MSRAQPGNQNATKHGAAAAERALTAGTPFTGLAAAKEREVTDELERDGIIAAYRKRAARALTVADLYYAAILGAENQDKLDSLVNRWGWLQNSALRALDRLQDLERRAKPDDSDTIELINQYREDNDAQDN